MFSRGVLALSIPTSNVTVGIFDHRSHLPCRCPYFSNLVNMVDVAWRRAAARRKPPLKATKGEMEKANFGRYKLHFGSLAQDGLFYKEIFIVRFHEVGSNGTMTIQSVANFFQEVGCNHFLSIGYSTDDGFSTTPIMREFGLIWVTVRMHIEIYKYPTWNDVIEIETWTQCEGGHQTRRDWIIKDYDSGEVIGRATSKWLLLNTKTRRLQKAPDDVLQEILKYSPKPPRLAFPKENNGAFNKIEKLDIPSQYSKLGLKPRRADLDMNQHVNNVTYIGWILESVPLDIQSSHELQSLTLDYKRECGYNDVIDSFTSSELMVNQQVNNLDHNGSLVGSIVSSKDNENVLVRFHHSLRQSNEGFETNRGKTEWRKRTPSI